jgi:predicted O-methyltransferase YrrM
MAVDRYNNGKFVEVGCYKGRSTSYMGVEIINSGKEIKLDCVYGKAETYDELYKNIEPVIKAIGKIHTISSVDASKLYPDNSLDFVFINTGEYDINLPAWWPKIKIGGIIAGDDFGDISYPGYVRGVNEYFGVSYIPETKHYPHWYIIKK